MSRRTTIAPGTLASRRDMLAAIGLLGAASSLAADNANDAGAAAPRTQSNTQSRIPSRIPRARADSPAFVLVHGTWHGGWVWKRVRRELQSAGYEVFAPTCTGCGERKHLMSPEVGLDTHITDVCNLIEYEELQRIVLVGHSFAGLTITGVADRMRERIAHLVYLDALVPSAPDRLSGVGRKADGSYPDFWEKRRAKFIEGYQMDFFAEYPLAMLMAEDRTEDLAWMRRRLTPHPARGWSDQLVLKNGGYQGLPKTFVRSLGQIYSPTSDSMIGPALSSTDWRLINAPFPRNSMVTHPFEIAAILAASTRLGA